MKDGINNYIVHRQRDAVNPEGIGTKAAAHYEIAIPAASARVVELRLIDRRLSSPADCKATWQIYMMEKLIHGKADRAFLEGMFHKLLMNFTWWVNRKDELGDNVFEGGFLGLDNIGLFDRSAPLPTGGTLEQEDGTSWMAMFCLDMLTIAVELALDNPVYEDLACKFFEHFIYIAGAMDRIGINNDELWDEQDGFMTSSAFSAGRPCGSRCDRWSVSFPCSRPLRSAPTPWKGCPASSSGSNTSSG